MLYSIDEAELDKHLRLASPERIGFHEFYKLGIWPIFPQAASHFQQVPDGDFVFSRDEAGQVLPDRVVELDESVVNQLKNHRGRI
ncbi:hypothetical protein ES708_30789 [subsurface metagenome]